MQLVSNFDRKPANPWEEGSRLHQPSSQQVLILLIPERMEIIVEAGNI